MPELTHAADGMALAYERHGEGPAIVLVHGFGSSRLQNWKSTGWYGGLTEAGFSIVAMDCRGHGDSGKPYEPEAYGHDRMANDVIAVMAACDLPSALICGYSMGGFIGLRLLAAHPERVIKLAIAGVGETYLKDRITSPQARTALADALLTPDKDSIIASLWPPACGRCRRALRLRLCRGYGARCWWWMAIRMIPLALPSPWPRHWPMGVRSRLPAEITCRRWATRIPGRP
jgi:pimeloyl-ACP methyl ester carboxylesterase